MKDFLSTILAFVSIGALYAQSPGAGDVLNFDGTDDYISVADNALLDIQDEITIEFWFKLNGSSNDSDFPRPVTKGSSTASNGAYGIWVRDPSEATNIGLRFISTTGTSYDVSNETLSNYDDSEWHHVAIVYSNSGDVGYLYFEGMLRATVAIPGNVQIRNTSDVLSIGGTSTDRSFNGYIDEVRIWNDARDQTEIRDNMCSKLVGNEGNLVGYWNMDNAVTGAGGVQDLGANSLDGTMTNMEVGDVETSEAPIGDASVHAYAAGVATPDLNIAHANGDDATVDITAGTATAVHLYRVDEQPNETTPPGTQTQLSAIAYYGVHIASSSGLAYTFTYNYDGYPGIPDENDLELAKRDNNADNTWSQESAVLNTTANTLTLTGQTGTEYILASTGSDPLPVELSYFETEVFDGRFVRLNWQTAIEINNDYFTIEHSRNGFDWEEIEKVKGAGNSSVSLNYSGIDHNPYAGISYYRLKQTDFDGQFQYSQIRSVHFDKLLGTQTAVYPNPSDNQIIIKGNRTDLSQIKIYNVYGLDVTGQARIVSNGDTQTVVDLSNLANGIYSVVTRTGTNKVYKK